MVMQQRNENVSALWKTENSFFFSALHSVQKQESLVFFSLCSSSSNDGETSIKSHQCEQTWAAGRKWVFVFCWEIQFLSLLNPKPPDKGHFLFLLWHIFIIIRVSFIVVFLHSYCQSWIKNVGRNLSGNWSFKASVTVETALSLSYRKPTNEAKKLNVE